jgi:hypothetical protein
MNSYRVVAHFNLNTRESFFDGYSPTHQLIRSGLGERIIEAASLAHVAELSFEQLNADDRPNGRMERSLSVGDVLEIRLVGEARTYWLACMNSGWTLLDDAPDADTMLDWMPFELWPRVA